MAQHHENMAKIDSDHTQAMTDLASRHHAAMTGHAMTGGKILSSAVIDEAGRQHDAEQARLDRQHQERTTAATLDNQQTIAKMKPQGPTK
jgi:hypothetical protein